MLCKDVASMLWQMHSVFGKASAVCCMTELGRRLNVTMPKPTNRAEAGIGCALMHVMCIKS